MKYAIVESGGKQFRAVEGGTIEVDRLPVEAGDNIKLEQVLLLADGENITVGTPHVKDSPVWTTVLEHFKGPEGEHLQLQPKETHSSQDRTPSELYPPVRRADRRVRTDQERTCHRGKSHTCQESGKDFEEKRRSG